MSKGLNKLYHKGISNLKNKTSYGHDKITNTLLKLFKREISVPLALEFNTSITEDKLPDSIKIAHITPIHKSGSKHELGNFRPVAILKCICKLLEKIIFKRLYSFWDQFNIWFQT